MSVEYTYAWRNFYDLCCIRKEVDRLFYDSTSLICIIFTRMQIYAEIKVQILKQAGRRFHVIVQS